MALDVNGNGRIDDGSELFGDGALQAASATPNGFSALAYYDAPAQGGNGDGVLDARDAVWPQLRLWRDADHDAFSAPSELLTLDSVGVHSFALSAAPSTGVDAHGNEFRFSSTISADAPVSSVVSDVWLEQLPLPTDETVGTVRDYTQWTCWSWAYAITGTGPNNPVQQMCDNDPTSGDPIATTAYGQLSKLVARYSVSTSRSTAMSRSHSIVFDAINYLPAGPSGYVCLGASFPDPDLYYAPPYDDDGSQYSLPIRTKCFGQVIRSGGGGGGCGT